MSLKTYQKKRKFTQTPEPKGEIGRKSKKKLIYIIQKHAASHLHYDLRLEWQGVLKSWAVPKGPSYNPQEKHLAVEVEDHPIEYAKFEGIIPKDEYGGGTVMLWDKGTWEPRDDPEQGLKKGKLEFSLHGEKLKGIWVLIRTRLQGKKSNWLLIKNKDEYAKNRDDKKLLNTNSVKTKRSMHEIAKEKNEVIGELPKHPRKAMKKKMPIHFKPELATLVKNIPSDENWIYEIKFDGYRLLSFIKNKKIKLITRNGIDLTEKFPDIVNNLKKLPIKSAIIDGELVALDENGITRFQLLQNAMELGKKARLGYYVFDLPYYDNYDLTKCKLIERKELLKQLCKHLKKNAMIMFSEALIENPSSLLKKACRMGLEGLIGKRPDSIYQYKRTKNWIKLKCFHEQELIIAGYTNPQGNRSCFGALLLGYYDNKGKLQYAGKVGTGFTAVNLKDLLKKMKSYIVKFPAFENTKNIPYPKNVHWLKPVLVAELEFKEWTADNLIRQASFKGLRLDKKAKDVIKENEK